jgi:hypothetical protein
VVSQKGNPLGLEGGPAWADMNYYYGVDYVSKYVDYTGARC